jgi:hypothetical protein
VENNIQILLLQSHLGVTWIKKWETKAIPRQFLTSTVC